MSCFAFLGGLEGCVKVGVELEEKCVEEGANEW